MAIARSLLTGVSGLRNNQVYMDVIGNNIANVNTVGFKAGRITFEEVFAFTLQGASRPPGALGGTNPMQVGLGTAIGSIDTLFTQGGLEATGVSTDMGIQGEGFFVLNDGFREIFTRSGAFQFDASGYLVSPNNGARVQGRLANSVGEITVGTPVGDIKLPFGQKSPARATTRVDFTGNLNAGETPNGTVLITKQLYAREIPGSVAEGGSNSDIKGLLALNTTTGLTTKLEGIRENTTTVTISDGIDRNEDGVVDVNDSFSFTYVGTNTPSKFDFNSLQELVDGINEVFGPNGTNTLTAQFNTDGSISFTRINHANPLIITSTNSNLQKALESANNRSTNITDTTTTTDVFSHVATRDDYLIDLRNSDGTSLGLADGDTIVIEGKVGGVDITTDKTLSVTSTTKYEEFTEQVRKAFRITTGSVEVNSTGGELKITGDGGTANEISAVNINAGVYDATTETFTTSRTNFNAVFDSTPNNWLETQSASDVQVAASSTVYDSLGQKHVITITFTKDVKTENKWTWEASVAEPASVSGGYSGEITFNTDGSLNTFTYDGAANSFQFEPKTGALNPLSIEINAGTTGSFNGITQLGTSSSLVAKDQDGYGLGELNTISIDTTGRIEGSFTNGVNQLLAKIVLATFNNESGLLRIGDNSYAQSANSGVPIIGEAGSSIQATITPGSLELSNVDLAGEFTNMIVAQRGFQANARVVTVTDQILTEIVNLKT